ncbi:MAG: hypothetical protein C0404_08465 [Verrucomicrobia bacterium]|nr:hypothetical protein [Verrucomicrobiota bacterium]
MLTETLIIVSAALLLIAAAALAVVVSLTTKTRHLKKRVSDLSAVNRNMIEETERIRRAQDEAVLSAHWYRHMFNNTNDMVFVFGVDEEGLPSSFMEVNDTACSELKQTRETLLTMSMSNIEASSSMSISRGYSKPDLVVLTDDYIKKQEKKISSNAARKLMEQILKVGNFHYESALRDRDGEEIPVEIDAQRFDMSDRTLIMCTAKNITARMESEKALSESRQQFYDFFRHSPNGIAMYDSEKVLTEVNQACLRMFGIPDKEQFSRFNMFDNPFIPVDAKTKLSRGENVRYEAVIDFKSVLQQAMFVSSRVGVAYYDMQITSMGVGKDFKPMGYFAQIQDSTDRRKAEESLSKTEQQLRQAEKMEAIGSMAGGIAHDFNNMLTPILGYSQVILERYPDTQGLSEPTKRILKAAMRAKDLVAQILTFSRKTEEPTKHQPVSVIPIAKEVLKLQRASLPANIEINRVIRTEMDTVMATPTIIHQVLMNLCTNAGYSMVKKGGNGTLDMMLTDFMAPTPVTYGTFTIKPGRYLRISVKDNGTGIEPQVLNRIFEPFFTTKPRGEGTGMGLSMVHGIIKGLNGAIHVETELGKGTAFHIMLPVIEKVATVETVQKTELPRGKERVLFVDDDAEVSDTAIDMLRLLGYQPTSVRNAAEAIALVTSNPSGFDMVVTDQIMPGMRGVDLAAELLKVRSDLPILLCTGFTDSVTPEQAMKMGIKEIIMKPLTLDNLALAMRHTLDQHRARENAANSITDKGDK